MTGLRPIFGRLLLPNVVLLLSVARPALGRTELVKLQPDDPASVPTFGASVAIDGDYIAVGAPEEVVGLVLVFHREGTGWAQQAVLGGGGISGGHSVAIEGERLVTGAPGFDMQGPREGHAKVYRRDGEEWVLEADLLHSGAINGDGFGHCVAISGDRIVVGAPGIQMDPDFDRAYVFRREGTAWVEDVVLVGSDTVAGDQFGTSVAIDGDVIVVGAPMYDVPEQKRGAVYVFRFDSGSWVEEAKLAPPAPGYIGASLSISGEVLTVGAPSDVGNGDYCGAAYVYHSDGGAWVQSARVAPSDGAYLDRFGRSVAIEGDVILAGAPETDEAGHGSGAAYLFRRYPAGWFEVAKLLASDAATSRYFGSCVATDGDRGVVGGPDAYVFSLSPEIPTISWWGLSVMTLVVLTAGTVLLRRASCAGSVDLRASEPALLAVVCSPDWAGPAPPKVERPAAILDRNRPHDRRWSFPRP